MAALLRRPRGVARCYFACSEVFFVLATRSFNLQFIIKRNTERNEICVSMTTVMNHDGK